MADEVAGRIELEHRRRDAAAGAHRRLEVGRLEVVLDGLRSMDRPRRDPAHRPTGRSSIPSPSDSAAASARTDRPRSGAPAPAARPPAGEAHPRRPGPAGDDRTCHGLLRSERRELYALSTLGRGGRSIIRRTPGDTMPSLAPLHPVIVHFAIALAVAGVLLRWLSLLGRVAWSGPAAATLLLDERRWRSSRPRARATEAHGPVERVPGSAQAVGEHEEWGKRSYRAFVVVGLRRARGTRAAQARLREAAARGLGARRAGRSLCPLRGRRARRRARLFLRGGRRHP